MMCSLSGKEYFVDVFNNLYKVDYDDTIYFCSNVGKIRDIGQLASGCKTEPDYAVNEEYEELHLLTLWPK